MSAQTLHCPNCSVKLKVPETSPGTSAVRCPKCQHTIPLTPAAPVSSSAPSPQPSAPPPLPPRPVSEYSTRPTAPAYNPPAQVPPANGNGHPPPTSPAKPGAVRDHRPVVERNLTNGHSQAEAMCVQITQLFERAAANRNVRVFVFRSPPFVSPPWVLLECWTRHPTDPLLTLRSGAKFIVRSKEFFTYPNEIDLELIDDKQTRTISGIIHLDDSDARNILDYLLFERKSTDFGLRRCRNFWFQLWRPKNSPERIGLDPLQLVVAGLAAVGALTLPFGIGFLILPISLGVWIYGRYRRRYVLSGGKPLQEPRRMIRLDSWQTLVWELGPRREEILQAVFSELEKVHTDGFLLERERISYRGVEGAEEREQLVVRFRRAIGFVQIYSYGRDLYVGWDAHVNCGTWVENTADVGYDKVTRLLCEVHTIVPGWNVPTEYDVTDANCLLERIHAGVTKIVKLKLAEHRIDQEIDFKILREARQSVAGRQDSAAKKMPGAGLLSAFRRVE